MSGASCNYPEHFDILTSMKKILEIDAIKMVLQRLRQEGKISLAYLYGSYESGTEHKRSDIDLAIYLNADDEKEANDIIDAILMAADKQVEILRLDDEDESPFVVQQALKGLPLIEPDAKTLNKVAHRVLHEAESIRYRRAISVGQS